MRAPAVLLSACLAVPFFAGSAGAAHTVTLSEDQQGRTVTVHQGDHLMVVLHSTYWTIDTARGKALATTGKQRTTGSSSPCRPAGSGCGTVRRPFAAVAVGSGKIIASRTTCGEALRCTGPAGSYQVTIRVVR